jgi:hypothetical protein
VIAMFLYVAPLSRVVCIEVPCQYCSIVNNFLPVFQFHCASSFTEWILLYPVVIHIYNPCSLSFYPSLFFFLFLWFFVFFSLSFFLSFSFLLFSLSYIIIVYMLFLFISFSLSFPLFALFLLLTSSVSLACWVFREL